MARKAYEHNIYTFTNFLSKADMTVYYDMEKELSYAGCTVFGGRELCSRVMIGFGQEEYTGYPVYFPISTLMISPLMEKFSDDLTHRDFLGALMNLGIERELLGDIIIKSAGNSEKRHSAYLFCTTSISEYIIDNLTKIKHTSVKCTNCTGMDIPDIALHLEPLDVIAASARIDAVIAAITRLSRNQVVTLFREKKISLNGRIFENNSYMLKENDMISVRGFGKYIYLETGGTTRKGRFYIHLQKYS